MNKWYLIAALWSGAALAVHPDFLQDYLDGSEQKLAADQLAQRSDWFDCSEADSPQTWCSESFYYYATQVMYASTVSDETKVRVQTAQRQPNNESEKENIVPTALILHVDYSDYNWSQLQLGLRSDGFSLLTVQAGQQHFDVRQRLNQQTLQQVDRDLVLFIHQTAGQFPKTLLWQTRSALAELQSDGKNIELRFTPVPESRLWDDAAGTQP